MKKRTQTPADETARSMALSLLESPLFALMVGLGETYFVAAAVVLRATPLQLGLTVGLPLAAGGLGSALAVALLGRLRHRRRVVVLSATTQTLVLAALSWSSLVGRLEPWSLIAGACTYHFAGMASGTAWSSWFGDVVPKKQRGRFFSRRNHRYYVAICVGMAAAGLMLEGLQPDAPGAAAMPGFALVFALAAAARLASTLLHARTPEPRFAGLSGGRRSLRYLFTDRGTTVWQLLLVSASLQLVTHLASPFFAPFMLKELRFTYTEYMIASLTVVLGKVFVLPRYGRVIDEQGAGRSYALAAVLAALVPLPWLVARGLGWVLVAQLFSGIAWASYEVSFFTVLLDVSHRRTLPQVVAAQNVLNGSAQLVGALAGSFVLSWLGGAYTSLFALSLGLRLLVATFVPRLVPRLGLEPRARRTLALRVIGFRPHGGIAHRPVFGDEDDAEPEAAKPADSPPGSGAQPQV